MDREKSRRFLDAFIDIEQSLQKIAGNTRHKPYYQVVNEASHKDAFVKDIAIELKEYGDLRNAIVHERINDQPIAEPHQEVVERLEKIGSLLKKPPKVKDEFLGNVVTCKSNDLVGEVAQQMYKNTFSKMPVYEGEKFLGLLTAEAITHWLGDQLVNQGKSLDKATVGEVLNYAEKTKNYQFVALNCPIFEVLGIFEEFSHTGQRLQAVIITKDGQPMGEPQGIITVFDLPKIYNLLEI